MSKTNKNTRLDEQRKARSRKYASYNQNSNNDAKPKDMKKTLLRLLSLLKPYRVIVVFVFILAAVGTIIELPSSDWMGDLVDAFNVQIQAKLGGAEHMDFTECLQIILKVFGLFFGFAICSFLQTYLMAIVSQKMINHLRGEINAKLSRLPLRYFDKYTKGEILSKIINDCDNISSTLQSHTTTILTYIIQLIGVGIYMFWLNWKLALIAVVVIPFSTVVTRLITRRSKVLFRQYWDHIGQLNGHIEEMYTGHNIVRIFNHKQQSVSEFNDIAEQLYTSTYKSNFISGLINPILRIFNNLNYVLICFVGATLVVKNIANPVEGGATIGMIVAFTSYASQFATPINGIAKIINAIQSTLACAERVFEILDEEEEPEDNPVHEITECTGSVDFEGVDFSYNPSTELIKNLNVNVKPGTVTAIVGPTGAGKTTIVNLLMRFYDVNGGAIKIDGIDIREMSRKNLRDNLGMVLQDTWIFKGTIRENIAYGRENATDEEILEAAKIAYFDEFVNELPDGYDTILEEEGVNISQGQRQLLTIARAVLADPKILILDEATSSVDTRTEVKIQAALDTLMQGRTNFVIAHRLSTIKNADMILVMRRGSIVETGTHQELLDADGFYASLYKSQYTGGIPPEEVE